VREFSAHDLNCEVLEITVIAARDDRGSLPEFFGTFRAGDTAGIHSQIESELMSLHFMLANVREPTVAHAYDKNSAQADGHQRTRCVSV